MKKRTYFALLAASARAQMRHHALNLRAELINPYPGMDAELTRTVLSVALDCAKSYRDQALAYEKSDKEEIEHSQWLETQAKRRKGEIAA